MTDKSPAVDPRLSITTGDRVVVRDDNGHEAEYEVTGSPWRLGHGAWVLGLSGISGGYALERVVRIVTPTRRRTTTMTDERLAELGRLAAACPEPSAVYISLRAGGATVEEASAVRDVVREFPGLIAEVRRLRANRDAAVAAETERCAGIARGWAEYHRRLGDSPDADFVDGEELADDIETDIRSGKQP